MNITVAICTWNRAAVLAQTLESIRELEVPADVSLDIVVVNNNCTDATDTIIDSFTKTLPICRLFEPNAGLSNARNCAADNFHGDLLIYLDDDITLRRNWLVEYCRAFHDYPNAKFFGGSLDLSFEVTPPKWLTELQNMLGDTYGKRDFGNDIRPFLDHEYPLGGNMAFRADVVHCQRFDSRFGRSGGGLLGGEELAYIDEIRQDGHSGVAVGSARGFHFVPEDRISAAFIWDWYLGCGKTLALKMKSDQCRRLFGRPRWAIAMYLKAMPLAWCLTPFRNRSWLKAFTDAAKARGIIEGSKKV